MSLMYCPECGHEISQNAIACPNCGLPIQGAEPAVVVDDRPVVPPVVAAPIRREERFPPWAIALFGVLGVLLLVVLFFLFRNSKDDGNVNVALNANRRAIDNRQVATSSVPPTETTVPGSQVSMPTTTDVPSTTTVPGSTTTAPIAPPPDKGKAVIRAQIMTQRGGTQPAKSARFYLLDKDVETILSEARVEPIEGNSLTSSLGLAAVFPDRYGEFQRAAMRALGAHAKYTGTTDGSGAANVGNIVPNAYYLFAITRVGNGFAMWNSPISIVPGDNVLDLSPASVTEIENSTGE
jgi:type II secretory pathway pseudopilin PulG